MAVVIGGDDHLLLTLSTGDVAANKIFYHTQCLRSFHNKFNITQKQSQTSLNKMSRTGSKFQLYHLKCSK